MLLGVTSPVKRPSFKQPKAEEAQLPLLLATQLSIFSAFCFHWSE